MEIATLVFTIMSGVGAIGALIAAICIYSRQKKISLFQRRRQILDDYEHFLFDVIPSWEWDGSCDWIRRYSDEELAALFDDDFLTIKMAIIDASDYCNKLLGDMKHAQTHGDCNGKTETEIEESLFGYIRTTRSFYNEKVGKYSSLFNI